MRGVDQVLEFWLNEAGPDKWYLSDPAFDAEITERFLPMWQEAFDGGCALWLTSARETLGYLVLTDQFPRNMFRGDARAFSTDINARAAAKCAIDRGWDLRIAEPHRQFFYLPLMHSENLCDQERCVRMMLERMPETGGSNMLHAKAHREVIREFGRFPYRNEALGRSSTSHEIAYMEKGGYGETVRALEAA
mgnify:CR=1 FL=1